MKILLDLQGAQTESRFRGIGRYSMALARTMARIAPQHEVWIALNSRFPATIAPIRQELAAVVPASRIVVFDLPDFHNFAVERNVWLAHAAELLREAFIQQIAPDVVLVCSLFEGFVGATVSAGRLADGPPTAVMLYDLIPLLNPDLFLGDPRVRQYYMHAVESLKRADGLLAISDFSRQEGLQALQLPEDRITAISTAADERFRPTEISAEQRRAVLEKFGVTKPFIFYTGAFEPRKNLAGLVQAYARLPAALRERFDIVAVGKHIPWERQHLLEAAQAAGVGPELHLSDYVSDDDLLVLYHCCHLFVFPSIHEGFGLPALEAMRCGAVVIASRLTSIPEVMGLDEAMFDPRDLDGFAGKLAQGLADEDFRARLRAHGATWAPRFSWERTAGLAIAALERMAEAGRQRARDDAAEAIRGRLLAALERLPRQPAPRDEQLAEVARSFAQNARTADQARAARTLPQRLRWRVEGKFDSSYSLALLNRETAKALQALGHDVSLWSTDGPGDVPPDPAFLAQEPDLAWMYRHAQASPAGLADVTSRNLYPPRVDDFLSRLRLLHHFAWEESGFPVAWVKAFNEHLSGVTCLSRHVEKVLVDHGVSVPTSVSGCGVDHWERVVPDAAAPLAARPFRFLHVSSCFPRKGADVLLAAYGQAFRASDPVSLVIKTFQNPHNRVHEWLAAARAADADFPEVLVIEEDLTPSALKALVGQCQALVAPSRAEGFGLPLAEAMLSGLAVVTTAWGGQMDFCDADNSWLVDFHFARAESHLQLPDSVWAEPDVGHLARQLRAVYEAPAQERARRALAGRTRLLQDFTWQQAAQRLERSARIWSERRDWRELRIGWVSTWNTRCGIASYSEELVRRLGTPVHVLAAEPDSAGNRPDEPWVLRCWKSGGLSELHDLAREIFGRELNTIVIQFNHYFYWYGQLTHIIRLARARGCVVVMVMHATTDPPEDAGRKLEQLAPALHLCHRVLVHTLADLNRLRAVGVVDNVALFPHGIALPDLSRLPKPTPGPRKVIASYGFFLPHKGLLELLQAFARLVAAGRDLTLRMVNAEYPAEASAHLIRAAAVLIDQLGLTDRVELHTDFLPHEESQQLLAGADLIVFPYQQTGESASGAARQGLAVGRPVVVTPIAIFDDLGDAVLRLPGVDEEAIATGLADCLDLLDAGGEPLQRVAAAAQRWRDAHRYESLAGRLHGMLAALQRQASWRMDASEERFKAQVGRKLPDGCESDGRPGFLLYGEYQTMPAGHYRATLYGEVGPEVGGWAFFDATILRGEGLLARQLLRTPNARGAIAQIEFELPTPTCDIEFRARVDDGTSMKVSHIIVTPVMH